MAATSFRDPIHEFIEVDPIELEIIDSAPFQRLRHIRQLGTSYLVYHGAEHTRFGHSLGVMHLASKAFDSALKNYSERTGGSLFDDETYQYYRRMLRIIALVHDLGHPPFSHTGEGVLQDGLKHEHFTKRIILETEIADIIRKTGDITPELIWLIYGEKDAEAIKNPVYKLPDFKFLKSFMDSDLDCDKMDYLLRDSHYCGVNYGRYDMSRLVDSLDVYRKDDIMQLAVQRGGLHAFEEFVISRYFMFIQVYFHKTRRYLDRLLSSLLRKLLNSGTMSEGIQLENYLRRNDNIVLEEIQKMKDLGDPDAIDFIDRNIYRCVYETPAQSTSPDKENFKIVFNSVKMKFPGTDVFQDSADKLATEIPVIEPYNADKGEGIPIIEKHLSEPKGLHSVSKLLSGLSQPISIRRIYTQQEKAEDIKRYIDELLNQVGG